MFNISHSYSIEEWADMLEKSVDQTSNWIRILFVTMMLITLLVGALGNLLTCVVIYCDKSMHTATNFYLFNLAVSDLLLAFGILLEIFGYLKYDKMSDYKTGEDVCKVNFFLVVALWNNGLLIMTALAIERYIAIWHPLLLNSKPVWRRVMKIIVIVWTLAILEALPEIWTVSLIKTDSFSICFIVPSKFARWLNGALGLINFIIPLGIMMFVYITIAFKVNVTPKDNPRDKIFNHRDNRSKVNKLIVALTLSFLCCWLPYFTLRVIIFAVDLKKSPTLMKNWDILVMVSSFNAWFSIVLNPMLFSLMSTKFRTSLKAMWNARFKKQPTKKQTVSVIHHEPTHVHCPYST